MNKYATITRIVGSPDKITRMKNALAREGYGPILFYLEKYISEIQPYWIKGVDKEITDILNLVPKDINQFLDKYTELKILYKLVSSKKIKVEDWHPILPEKKKKPDFKLTVNNSPVFLEVKRIRETAIEQEIEKSGARICENFRQEVQQVLEESDYKSYAVEVSFAIDFPKLFKDKLEDITVKEAVKKVTSLLQDKGSMDKLINQTRRYRDLTELPLKKIHQSGDPKALENLLNNYGQYPCIEFTLDEVSEELGNILVTINPKKSPGIYCVSCSTMLTLAGEDEKKVWNDIANKAGQLPRDEISILLFWFDSCLYSQNSIEGERLEFFGVRDDIKYRWYPKLKEEIFEEFSNLYGIIAWTSGSWKYHISPTKSCLPSLKPILEILTEALNSQNETAN